MANEQSQSNAHKGNHKLAKTYNFFSASINDCYRTIYI